MEKSVKELLEDKKKQTLTEKDKEELSLIETMLADEYWFNKVDPDTAGTILLFLGVPREELEDYYLSLLYSGLDDKTGKYNLIDEEQVRGAK